MADTGPVPDVAPVSEGSLRDAALAEIEAQLAAANPHAADMDLPPALTQDGGRPS
jgi:hypothetical protein